jgi:RNA polymerase sigma-70 factor (ECF subfamily)
VQPAAYPVTMPSRGEGGSVTGGDRRPDRRRSIVYCVIPRDLAPKLHESLRRHFRDEPGVRVVVERRDADRRGGQDRRGEPREIAAAEDRRRIRAVTGRRIAERRAQPLPVEPPALPKRARPHADRLLFFERLEPSTEHAEDLDTARLVMRIQSGDSDAFADLYTRYFSRVYAYLRVVFRDEYQAEEATQHVFTKVFEALPRYERRRQAFSAWLFVVVRNHALNELEHRRRVELVEPAAVPERATACLEDDAEELDSLNWISDPELLLFVERLPLSQRQALVLRYMLDLSTADVARALGRSEEDVRQLQSRALRFLRRRLGALGRGPSETTRSRMRSPVRVDRVARRRRFSLL